MFPFSLGENELFSPRFLFFYPSQSFPGLVFEVKNPSSPTRHTSGTEEVTDFELQRFAPAKWRGPSNEKEGENKNKRKKKRKKGERNATGTPRCPRGGWLPAPPPKRAEILLKLSSIRFSFCGVWLENGRLSLYVVNMAGYCNWRS